MWKKSLNHEKSIRNSASVRCQKANQRVYHSSIFFRWISTNHPTQFTGFSGDQLTDVDSEGSWNFDICQPYDGIILCPPYDGEILSLGVSYGWQYEVEILKITTEAVKATQAQPLHYRFWDRGENRGRVLSNLYRSLWQIRDAKKRSLFVQLGDGQQQVGFWHHRLTEAFQQWLVPVQFDTFLSLSN